jgi:hypothetical protein
MDAPSRSVLCEPVSRELIWVKIAVREFGSLKGLLLLPARNCDFETEGICLTSRRRKRLRKEATEDMRKAVSRSLVNIESVMLIVCKGSLNFLPTVLSITHHIFIQEASGIAVNDVTSRIIPIIPVMIVSEKISARASFLCSFI